VNKRVFAIITVLLMGTAYAEAPEKQCLACHQDELSLQSVPTDELKKKVIEIIDKRASHVTPIADMSEAQLEELVEKLTKPVE
jgi:hypothetical protein